MPNSRSKGRSSRLQALVDTAVDGVMQIDANGIVMLFNPACERLFGYAAEEILGANVKILMPTPFHEEHDTYLSNYHATGERKIIGIGREVVGRRRDGTTFAMELSVGEAQHNGETIFVGIVHDVSERKQSEQYLLEGAAQMRTVVDTAVDGVILIDDAGLVEMFNPACEKLFGYSADEVIGQNVKLLMPDPFHHEHDAYLHNYKMTGERKIIGIGREVVGRRKNGETFAMELSVGEAKRRGHPVFVGVIHDISERKRDEEQRELLVAHLAASNEERGHFAYVASHDLQQHLRMISAFSSLLASEYAEVLDARAQEFLSLILTAGEHMRELVDDLLEYGRLDTTAERDAWFESKSSLETALESLSQPIQESGATVTLGALPPVFGNRIRFTRLAQNLVANALKYVKPDCKPQIFVSAELDQGYWKFSVADNGIGIKPEYYEKIFAPFSRLHAKNEYNGSGLGLAICRKIVSGFGGKIWVESEEDRGSNFMFTVRDAESEAT